jgi:type IV pilus assembly protein PilC
MLNAILPADITELISELALLSANGVPCKEALIVLQQGQEKPAMQQLIHAIHHEVEQSGQLSAGLARYPRHFEPVIVDLIHESEQQGHLPATLEKIAHYRETNDTMFNTLISRLLWVSIYPIALLLITLLIAIGLLTFVVPVFANLFRDFGADLPAETAAVVILSDIAVQYWPMILGSLLVLVIFLDFMRRRGTLFLYIPFLGSLFHRAILIRFLHSYALLYSPTASPVKILEGCAQLVHNIPYTHCLRQIKEQVNDGQTFPEVLIQQPHFPKKVGHLAAVGLKTQKIDELFNKIAIRYAQQLHNKIELASKVLFIIALIIMGSMIGFLVIAMYMPIFKMGSVL